MFQKILIASGNKGKIKEIKDLLEPLNFEVVSTLNYDFPEPDETEDSFSGNALIKSRYWVDKTGITSISDDSGLEIEALGGKPGIHSARLAEDENGNRDFSVAMKKIENMLKDKGIVTRGDNVDHNKLKCNFTCALAINYPDGKEKVFVGKVFGRLQFPPTGEKGFGYDPIFVADGYDKTFAEIDPIEKHAISHRAEAFKLMLEYLKK